jgi:hypothetical protein
LLRSCRSDFFRRERIPKEKRETEMWFVGRLPVVELPISRCIIIKHGAAGSTSLDKAACKILDRGDAGRPAIYLGCNLSYEITGTGNSSPQQRA